MSDVVAIESLASGGSGVAHLPDGMTVFVPRTAPGDRVRLRDVRKHRRHAEAFVAEVVEPGPARVSPPCDHFVRDNCGGCQWQHVGYEEQLRAKAAIVGNALRRIGRFDVSDPPVISSPRRLGYRTTITLTVRHLKGGAVAGFHDAESPDRVFMLESCAIARDEINALWQTTRTSLDSLPRGDDVRLQLRVGRDGVCSVAVSSDGVKGGTGFLQVNEEVAALLHSAVVEAAGGVGRVLDLYAGAGDTAVPLAASGRETIMVERDSRSVREAESRAKAVGARLRCIVGDVEDHVGALLPADVVIVNPPRAGLSEEVAARLRACAPARLIYVSCDPATLARDLTRMKISATDVMSLRAFDMFPQTSHVETLLVARAGSGA